MMKNPLIAATALLLLLAVLSGCYTHLNQPPGAEIPDANYVIDREINEIIYTPDGWPQPLQADLLLPRKPGAHPVVLMIHGGGWANRSRNDMTGISRKLVQHGYAVLNVNYRFAPKFTYPAQVYDLQQALVWLSENATDYDLDLERVNTWGYSSGAHLAALLGGLGEHESNNGKPLPKIRSVVAGGIPSDLRKYSDSPIVKRFMGGKRDEMLERYAEASPVFHVSSDDPPVFLYHGKLDTLVAEDQASDYHQTLLAAGVDSELYLHGWHGHMTMFLFGGDAESRAIAFLNRNNATPRLLATE